MLTKILAKDTHQGLTKAVRLQAFEYSQSESVEGRALGCLQSLNNKS
jgi:hypothetical protein